MSWDEPAERARKLIERGLERYQRGELRDALAQWELALEALPSSQEATALVEFARARLSSPDSLAGRAVPLPGSTSGLLPPQIEDRRPRRTLASPIPRLLAPLTSPGWRVGDAAPRGAPTPPPDDGAPEIVVEDNRTRPVGESSGPKRVSQVAAEIAGTLLQRARRQAVDLIDRCTRELRAGRAAHAAGYADQALTVADEAPSPGIGDVLAPAHALFEQAFAAHVGPDGTIFAPIFHLEQLGARKLDARAGFLLSRIEGPISLAHIAEASGMPRFDVLRGISVLVREGALKRV